MRVINFISYMTYSTKDSYINVINLSAQKLFIIYEDAMSMYENVANKIIYLQNYIHVVMYLII